MKNKNFSFVVPMVILGILLTFYGIFVLSLGNNDTIVLGIFALLIGLGYVACSVLYFLKRHANVVVQTVINTYAIMGYLVYILVTTIVMIVLVGAENLSVLDWIIDSLLFALIPTVAIFEIISMVNDKQIFKSLKDVASTVLVAVMLMDFIFNGNNLASLADISIYHILTFASFALIVFSSLKEVFFKASKLVELEPVEKAPVEEVEEEPVAEEEEVPASDEADSEPADEEEKEAE